MIISQLRPLTVGAARPLPGTQEQTDFENAPSANKLLAVCMKPGVKFGARARGTRAEGSDPGGGRGRPAAPAPAPTPPACGAPLYVSPGTAEGRGGECPASAGRGARPGGPEMAAAPRAPRARPPGPRPAPARRASPQLPLERQEAAAVGGGDADGHLQHRQVFLVLHLVPAPLAGRAPPPPPPPQTQPLQAPHRSALGHPPPPQLPPLPFPQPPPRPCVARTPAPAAAVAVRARPLPPPPCVARRSRRRPLRPRTPRPRGALRAGAGPASQAAGGGARAPGSAGSGRSPPSPGTARAWRPRVPQFPSFRPFIPRTNPSGKLPEQKT